MMLIGNIPVTTPTGYASMVKDIQNETALPIPGSQKFKPEHSDYGKVLRNLRRFIETVSIFYMIQGIYLLRFLEGSRSYSFGGSLIHVSPYFSNSMFSPTKEYMSYL